MVQDPRGRGVQESWLVVKEHLLQAQDSFHASDLEVRLGNVVFLMENKNTVRQSILFNNFLCQELTWTQIEIIFVTMRNISSPDFQLPYNEKWNKTKQNYSA